MKRTMYAGMMCVLVLGLTAAQAAPETLFSAGFEAAEGYTATYLLGNTIPTVNWGYGYGGYLGDPDNQQGWYGERYFNDVAYGHGMLPAQVTTAVSHSGSASVEIPAQTDGYYYPYYRHAITPKDSGILTLQWWQKLEAVTLLTSTTNNLNVGALHRNGFQDNGLGGQLDGWTDSSPVSSDSPNRYTVGTAGTTMTVNVPGCAAAGAWVGYRYVADLDYGTFDLYINTGAGWNQVISHAAMPRAGDGTAPNLIDSIYFYQMDYPPYFSGTTKAYIDDILVTWDSPQTVLLSAGFEQSEGYSDGSLNTKLVGGYLYDWYSPYWQGTTGGDRGSAQNQQGWYGEKDQRRWAYLNKGVVTNGKARTGTQSFEIPTAEDHYDVFYRHPIEEKTNGFLTLQMYVYLEGTGSTQDTWNNLILTANDRFNGNFVEGNEYGYGTDYGALGPGAREDMFFSAYDGYINAYSYLYLYYNRANSEAVTHYEANVASPGRWIGRKVVIDIDHSTATHYVDKNNNGTWTLVGVARDNMTTNGGGGPALIDNIAFFQQIPSPTTTGVYVDDVLVTWTGQDPAGVFFNPPGGTFIGSIAVAVTCNTATADIYYTTDNTTPSATNGTHIVPGDNVTVDHTLTLKAVAVVSGNTGAVYSASYTIIPQYQNMAFNVPAIDPITVDGDLSDWTASTDWSAEYIWWNSYNAPPLTSHTKAKFAWNDATDMLYVAVQTDQANGGHVVVGLTMDNIMGNPTDGNTGATQLGFDTVYGIVNEINLANHTGDVTDGVLAARSDSGGVYTYEMAIPLWDSWLYPSYKQDLSVGGKIYLYAVMESALFSSNGTDMTYYGNPRFYEGAWSAASTLTLVAGPQAGYNLSGTVVLDSFTGNVPPITGVPVVVQLKQGATIITDNVSLDGGGHFTVPNVAPGTYAVRVKASHWTAKIVTPVTITSGDVSIGSVTLTNGDCNGDNNVTGADLSVILTAMDAAFDATADLDCDGEITSTDVSIVLLNMDAAGENF